ncbi:ABC transporter substrate-binding protein [Sulfurovum lithotrophicum]|uniref:ABC transporter substrate-binding protein n=1 Tax=Sulfurovum lithotrophicum TaxID=206403 RepID=A0A7U4M1I5_9BACT|nr:MlaD family protein [Sulfurovum lithotrophicum]AKF25156.1 ABC transporter substrate-binding protein [Sulfurovum lithotrophicum]
MYSRVNYTIVGIFVLLFGAGLVAFTFWLAKYGIKNEYNLYKLEMTESISGLSKDSTVRLRGVDVGRVSEIRINPDNIEQIEVFLKIRSDVPIKEDMKAHTEMLGITGLLAIEIEGGTNKSKLLKPKNGEIPIIQTEPSWLNKTSKGLGNMAENLSVLIEKAEKIMSDRNIETFGSILENTDQMTAKAVVTLDEFNTTMQVYKNAAVKLNDDIHSASSNFTRITENTVPALKSLQRAAKDFNRLTLLAEKSLNRGDYNIKETFEPMLVDIGILTEQLTDLTRELQQSPSNILFKSRKQRRGPGE